VEHDVGESEGFVAVHELAERLDAREGPLVGVADQVDAVE
jgi:hypothetical protein